MISHELKNYSESGGDLSKKLIAKVLLLGESGVGKTSLMENLARSRQQLPRYVQSVSTTMGVDFKIIRSNLTPNIKLIKPQLATYDEIKYRIWDASGSERFYPLITSYYRNIDALVVVCDLCDRGSFQQIRTWLDDFNKHSPRIWSEIPTILVGNKSDLVDSYQVKPAELSALAEELKVTSLITNVKDASPEQIIDRLNLLLVDYWVGLIDYYRDTQRVLNINKNNQERSCCQIS